MQIKINFLDEEPILVDKHILCKCDYFNKMLNSGLVEEHTAEININNYSRDSFLYILEFISTNDFNDNFKPELLAEILDLATMYALTLLKISLAEYLKQHIHDYRLDDLIYLAETYELLSLKDIVLFEINSNNVSTDELSINVVEYLDPMKKLDLVLSGKYSKDILSLNDYTIHELLTIIQETNIFTDKELLSAIYSRYKTVNESFYIKQYIGEVICVSRSLNYFSIYINLCKEITSKNKEISINDYKFKVIPEYYNNKQIVIRLSNVIPISSSDNVYSVENL